MYANQEPKPSNTLQVRTIDCIYLTPSTSIQDGHEVLHIANNKVLTRRSLTELPIFDDILTLVEQSAKQEEMSKSNTKYDVWFAGVNTPDKDILLQTSNEIMNKIVSPSKR